MTQAGGFDRRARLQWAGVFVAVEAPVYLIVNRFGEPGQAMAAAAFGGLLLIILAACWSLRRQGWYWMAIAAIVILHVTLIIMIPWSNGSYPAPELWPIGIADFLAMYGFIRLAEKAMTRRDGPGPSAGGGDD